MFTGAKEGPIAAILNGLSLRPFGGAMQGTASAQATNLFLLEDLEDVSRTSALAQSELDALRAVSDWIKSFVARPHEDLGRSGPVCPFVPGALERKALWLAPEQIADRTARDVVALVEDYKGRFLSAQPVDGNDANYKSVVVVFTDLAADRAKGLLDDVLEQLGARSYVEEGLVLGAFYASNEGTAIYNSSFRPFTSPVPFLLMRLAVIGDWKFHLDDEDWLDRWAGRYGASGARVLAEELRRLPWRESRA